MKEVQLDIWLDRNLNWGEHIRIKTKKVQGLLHKLAGVSGDLWGYKPLIGKYCWKGLAQPILSFGCIGWIPSGLPRRSSIIMSFGDDLESDITSEILVHHMDFRDIKFGDSKI